MNKALLLPLIISIFFTFHIKAQNSEYQKTGKIYFLRATGFNGAISALRVFIDGEFACKLNNNKYSIHEVSTGKHECSVQSGGNKLKKWAEKFQVNVEAGKTTYVQVFLALGPLSNNVYCQEITENSAITLKKRNKMKIDNKCL